MRGSWRFWMAFAFLLSAGFSVAKGTGNDAKLWGVEIELSGLKLHNADDGDYSFYPSDDEGNSVQVLGHWYPKRHWDILGGVYFEQDGILTDYADGIGLKKVNRLGLACGAKYYFLSPKWMVQPNAGVLLFTNVLNWNRKGQGLYMAEDAYAGEPLQLDWHIRCSPLSVAPRLGVDVRLISSLSLSLGYEWRLPVSGSSTYSAQFVGGTMSGQSTRMKDTFGYGFSIGLKMDFPARGVSEQKAASLLGSIISWFGGRR